MKSLSKFSRKIVLIIIVITPFRVFLHQRKPSVSLWSLSDNKSPQDSKIFLGILDDINNAVVWMVSNYYHSFYC